MYLAIDANMELAEEEDAFDVFGYLKKLRQSRRGLIENLVSHLIDSLKLDFQRISLKKYFYLFRNSTNLCTTL